ncbi:oxidoreductase family protein [Polaribacter aquimarinus]|uniref:Choline kinase n=1 Tax=Polaribacter aquimarinus TaxID=2100726 RepID=A0A2U2JEV3_9FLAO|nr:oxidoreductase family protein [Polaribacter aquimarinus]PWG06845.1 choline kinase [Polaribacter aquimarinus]
MKNFFKSFILEKTGASSLQEKEVIQNLWSGYGKIIRVALKGCVTESVVVKNVQLPKQTNHPRGWNSDIGHQRKLKSYQVETNWYQNYSHKSSARLPKCFGVTQKEDEVLIILEDLDAAGFPIRKSAVAWKDIEICLEWLAKFHASYLGKVPKGLWETGTYWHLATRPQEMEVLSDISLKEAASKIDTQLNNCQFKTLVHGDAKLANFCFAEDGKVASVDFQYVGGGCGMKDVAYFVGSCLYEEDCERLETQILDTYFGYLHQASGSKNEALEKEWRALYHVAWADFHRFLKGWSPGHWKINSYSERITQSVIQNL